MPGVHVCVVISCYRNKIVPCGCRIACEFILVCDYESSILALHFIIMDYVTVLFAFPSHCFNICLPGTHA